MNYYDIYLWTFSNNKELIKIPHLTHDDAVRLTSKWYELNELHDYMLVLEGSTPWLEKPNIVEKDKQWLEDLGDIDG